MVIGAIAESLCFADASSFSRAFRREFGMSPSDVRAATLSGLRPADQARRSPDSQARSLTIVFADGAAARLLA